MEGLFSNNNIINIGGFVTRASNVVGLEFYKWNEKETETELQDNVYKVVVSLNSATHPGKILFMNRHELVKFLVEHDYLITGTLEDFLNSLEYSFFDVMQASALNEDEEIDDSDEESIEDF